MATINGTAADETLTGTAGESNQIAGNGGNDTIIGRGEDDLLLGGAGNDTVKGANGHDTLFGGGNDDVLEGGNGGDRLSGDKGTDILTGGNGNDTFVINANHVGESHDTVTDFDTGRVSGAQTFNDSVEIKNVDGEAFVFEQMADGTTVLSVDGTAMAEFMGSEGGVAVAALLNATTFVGTPGSVEVKINGTDGDDVLIGATTVSNTILGNDGNDTILGGDLADKLDGGTGDDLIRAGGGSDAVNGGGGDDTINGGEGDDELKGSVGDDVMLGGLGNDKLSGGSGDDKLYGGEGDDLLFGGEGMDKIFGGTGNDRLTGGKDSDMFFFTVEDGGASSDTITDFSISNDLISLRGLELVQMIDVGGNAKLFFDTGASVLLKGVSMASLNASDFVLQDGASLGSFF